MKNKWLLESLTFSLNLLNFQTQATAFGCASACDLDGMRSYNHMVKYKKRFAFYKKIIYISNLHNHNL